jgi:hypothetical protein
MKEKQYLQQSKQTISVIVMECNQGRFFLFDEQWRDNGRPQLLTDAYISEVALSF